jgi:hypothetical protein
MQPDKSSTCRAFLQALGLCVVSVALFSTAARAETEETADTRPPLQIRLDVPLDNRRSAIGTPVFGSALAAWDGPQCAVAKGGVVAGHIAEAERKTKPQRGGVGEAQLSILFDKADCNGEHAVPIHLLLYAVVVPAPQAEMMMYEDPQLYGNLVNHSTAGRSNGKSSTERIQTDVSDKTEAGLYSGAIHAGQVLGEKQIALKVGAGPEGSSRLHSAKNDFRIGAGATLLLVIPLQPASNETNAIPASPSTTATPSPATAPISIFAETTPAQTPDAAADCGASCSDSAVPFATSKLKESTHSDASVALSLEEFGYKPTARPELVGFDHDTAAHFLTDSELLLTFELHQLRGRTGDSWPSRTRRTVRAVLLDASTKQIKQAVDWNVDGDGQYIWQAGTGRVLVHKNSRLYLLGAGLKELAILPADTDVPWVTASASGKKIAIGMVRERHDRQTHEMIEELSGRAPEEDVNVWIIDDSGNILMKRQTTSAFLPPVFTDDGEFAVVSAGQYRWRVVRKADDGSAARALVTLASMCVPRLSAPIASGLFVTGCDTDGARWYQVLNENGRTLLKGRPSMEEIEDSMARGGDDIFAIRVVNLVHAKPSASNFTIHELGGEHIEVYRQHDSKPLLAVAESQYPVSRDNYALSANGERLAVLTKTGVEIFGITRQGASERTEAPSTATGSNHEQ